MSWFVQKKDEVALRGQWNQNSFSCQVVPHQNKCSSWPSWWHSESLLLENISNWRWANTADFTLSAGRKPVSQHTISPNPSVPMSTTLRHVLLQYRTHVSRLSTCEHLIVLHSCWAPAAVKPPSCGGIPVSDVSGSAWTLLVVYMNNYINLYLFNVNFCKPASIE